MKIPYVIDNQEHRMANVLTSLLERHRGQSVDIATAYVTVGGLGMIAKGLEGLGSLRLLLGHEPSVGEELGLRPDAERWKRLLRRDIEALPFREEIVRLVEDLIRLLRRESVSVRVPEGGFLHAKCYLFYSDRPRQQLVFEFERFKPIVAIVGSSNLTAPGLTTNRELNLVHKVLLEPDEVEDPDAQAAVAWLADKAPPDRILPENRLLIKSQVGARAIIEVERWFEAQWGSARDFREELIDILDRSKFGHHEYPPYLVYMKSLYELLKDDIQDAPPAAPGSAVELTEFQEDAVRRARRILKTHHGVLVGDSVGLGKTWIGKKLLEDFAYHARQRALMICPASLREMWRRELGSVSIAAEYLSQEEMGRPEFDPTPFLDVDAIVIDESHNFRNPNAQRTQALEGIILAHGGRGRAGSPKKVIMLTATPVHTDLMDLYAQILLIARGERNYFAGAGIPDLRRYFQRVRQAFRKRESAVALFPLLEQVVVRRTRTFIRAAYPNATLHGRAISWPRRQLRTVRYDLEQTYPGIYEEVVRGVEALRLAPYHLEEYKREGIEVDELEKGRQIALVSIFKTRYLKRFESSVEAFRISVRRALQFQKTFSSYLAGGVLLSAADFRKALSCIEVEGEEDEIPRSLATQMDETDEIKDLIERLPRLDPKTYDVRRIHDALQSDIDVLTNIWHRIEGIRPEQDAKLRQLKRILTERLKGRKVLLFTYFKDTARYLYEHLSERGFLEAAGNPLIRKLDSGADPKERQDYVTRFAPKSNERAEIEGTKNEIDILISTDVLAEGQNLQDCGALVNYDLHWNPTRMVQRAGRIDRMGSPFPTLEIFNMFPDQGLERLLRLVERLTERIEAIDRTGFLDASVLGEEVHPRSFNTLRRICAEEVEVLDEEEELAELPTNEGLVRELHEFLGRRGGEEIGALPDGIHSGLTRQGERGVFFHFAAGTGEARRHFWRYYDLAGERIEDNQLAVARLIACTPDMPRVIPSGVDPFEIQERVVAHILGSATSQETAAEAPPQLEQAQATALAILHEQGETAGLAREERLKLMEVLLRPIGAANVRRIREALKEYSRSRNVSGLVECARDVANQLGATPASTLAPQLIPVRRDDLRLVCFMFVS